MQQKFFFKLLTILATAVAAIVGFASLRNSPVTVAAQQSETQGTLQVIDSSGKPKGQCPLKQTNVKAEISGFLSRVVVTQEFENPFKEKIEAVYTFPLPQNAAVDDMTISWEIARFVEKSCAAKKPRQFTKLRRRVVRSPVCSIRNERTSSRNQSPTSCRAKQ